MSQFFLPSRLYHESGQFPTWDMIYPVTRFTLGLRVTFVRVCGDRQGSLWATNYLLLHPVFISPFTYTFICSILYDAACQYRFDISKDISQKTTQKTIMSSISCPCNCFGHMEDHLPFIRWTLYASETRIQYQQPVCQSVIAQSSYRGVIVEGSSHGYTKPKTWRK